MVSKNISRLQNNKKWILAIYFSRILGIFDFTFKIDKKLFPKNFLEERRQFTNKNKFLSYKNLLLLGIKK